MVASSKSTILASSTGAVGKFSLQTHRSYHPNWSHLSIAASPHPPVVVLSLLQQVLVASEVFLLVAHPAAATGRGAGVRKMCLIWLFCNCSGLGSCLISSLSSYSHPSEDFQGADVVHEGLLCQVHPGHEVFHVAVYGPGFPAEVGLFEDDHLRRKSDDQGVGHRSFHTLNTLHELITAGTFSIPLVHLRFPPAVHPKIEKRNCNRWLQTISGKQRSLHALLTAPLTTLSGCTDPT